MFHIKFYLLLMFLKSVPFVHFNNCSFTTPMCIYCNLSYKAVDLYKNKINNPTPFACFKPF